MNENAEVKTSKRYGLWTIITIISVVILFLVTNLVEQKEMEIAKKYRSLQNLNISEEIVYSEILNLERTMDLYNIISYIPITFLAIMIVVIGTNISIFIITKINFITHKKGEITIGYIVIGISFVVGSIFAAGIIKSVVEKLL